MNKRNSFDKRNQRFLEKVVRRYVIVSPDTCEYLFRDPKYHGYGYTNDVSIAVKFIDTMDANWLIKSLQQNLDVDLTVVPLEITYELINESGDCDLNIDELTEIGLKKMRRDMDDLWKLN